MARKVISAQKLHSLLVREFEEVRMFECASLCTVPLPVFREPVNGEAHNWFIGPALSCPRYCHKVIAQAVEKFAREYDIETSPKG